MHAYSCLKRSDAAVRRLSGDVATLKDCMQHLVQHVTGISEEIKPAFSTRNTAARVDARAGTATAAAAARGGAHDDDDALLRSSPVTGVFAGTVHLVLIYVSLLSYVASHLCIRHKKK